MEKTSEQYDAVVVGAGFSGLYMLHKLRELGLSARAYEVGDGVGGTWYWNRYPGARCDVESVEYCYSFDPDLEQEWEWTERYPGQPEVERYANHVADRFDLRRDIQFETRVVSATFDEALGRWEVRTDRGDEVSAQYFITAVGCLSASNMPEIAGRDSFEGILCHTGRYPAEGIDFSGKRVAVIGTGSTGIQAIPVIAAEAGHLTVFQRTAQYSIPARNRQLLPGEQEKVKADYPRMRAESRRMPAAIGSRIDWNEAATFDVDEDERDAALEARWERGGIGFLGAFSDMGFSREANDVAARFVKEKILAAVDDPEVAERLMPDTVIGCKRLCLDTDYFETYNRPNVELVDISSVPITEITPTGLVHDDRDYQFDVIVFATGFDAMTGALLAMDIQGRGGVRLGDAWAEGPRAYLGLGVPGFPNMFTITGPGSPSVLTNMIMAIEHHVEWIGDCLNYMGQEGLACIEADAQAAEDWVDHVNAIAAQTLFTTCNSWYLGANIPGKKRVFMPLIGFPPYTDHCAEIAAAGYEGFVLS